VKRIRYEVNLSLDMVSVQQQTEQLLFIWINVRRNNTFLQKTREKNKKYCRKKGSHSCFSTATTNFYLSIDIFVV